MDGNDLAPPALVGHADHDLAVEAARTAQRLVDRVWPVGRGDDDEVGALFQPVHQRQQLGDKALLRLARHMRALGRDRIDLVDEDDRGRSAAGFLEHFAQALFALAIARAHDLRAVDGEELGIALVGDGLCQPGLAGARRAVEQHALGRLDAKADEQLGIVQRQFDHFAQRADGVLHPADIVIIDRGAGIAGFLELCAQLHLGILVDMDDALGAGRGDGEADLGEGIGRRAQQLAHVRGHVLHRLLTSGRHQIAGHQRAAEEIALQRLGRPLQAHLALGGSEHHAGGGTRLALGDLDMLARSGLGIAALEPVEPDNVKGVIFRIGRHRDGCRGALADDLDDIAFGDPQLLECRARHAGDALTGFFLPRGCDLKPHSAGVRGGFCFGHEISCDCLLVSFLAGIARNGTGRLQSSRNAVCGHTDAGQKMPSELPWVPGKKMPGTKAGLKSLGEDA